MVVVSVSEGPHEMKKKKVIEDNEEITIGQRNLRLYHSRYRSHSVLHGRQLLMCTIVVYAI